MGGQLRRILKRINGEYLLLCAVILSLMLLVYSSTGRTQQPPEEITLSTMYPSPSGIYDRIFFRQFVDWDRGQLWDGTPLRVDPYGQTALTNLRVAEDLKLGGNIFGYSGGSFSTCYISLLSSATQRAVLVDDLRASARITMGAVTPPPTNGRLPIGGWHIWDVAEGMTSALECENGDVVVIDNNGNMLKSREKFSTNIAGVISEDPKLYFGNAPGTMPVALAGIVKCKVTTENGPIKKGAMLVSSSEPGYAMAADVRDIKPGMRVGRALQNFDQGQGKIYILVNQ